MICNGWNLEMELGLAGEAWDDIRKQGENGGKSGGLCCKIS